MTCSIQGTVRYVYPANRNPARITKTDKKFAAMLDFKDPEFSVNIRDIHKIEKNNYINVSIFWLLK